MCEYSASIKIYLKKGIFLYWISKLTRKYKNKELDTILIM